MDSYCIFKLVTRTQTSDEICIISLCQHCLPIFKFIFLPLQKLYFVWSGFNTTQYKRQFSYFLSSTTAGYCALVTLKWNTSTSTFFTLQSSFKLMTRYSTRFRSCITAWWGKLCKKVVWRLRFENNSKEVNFW